MAVKGIGISNDIFVDQTYYTPESYTIPTPSQGDYASPQTYFEADYVNNALDLFATFTIQAEGTVFSTSASKSSVFTMQVTCTRVKGAAEQPSLDSAITLTCDAIDLSLAIIPQVRVFTPRFTRAIVTTIGHLPDAVWNTYAESDVIDRTWDDFSDYQWDYLDDVFIRSNVTKALAGKLQKATATITAFAEATLTVNRIRGFVKTAPSVSSMSVNANFTADTSQTITAVGSQTTTLSRFRGIDQTITAQATVSANANATFDLAYGQGVTATATVDVVGNVTFDSSKTLTTQASVDAQGNVRFDSVLSLSALYSQLSAGRLILIPDPWNTIKVKKEIRTIVLPIESRSLPVNQETRVNSITTETRSIKVPQETRRFKIFKPQFTSRSSIPRVRQET